MAATFGLDFGTTNSLISVIRPNPDNQHQYGPDILTQGGRPHPSVVWYPGGDPVIGQTARDQLHELVLGVSGNIVRSPKMFLGHPIGIDVGGVKRQAVDIVADILRYLREDARKRKFEGNPFNTAVVTIPVTMLGPARADLRQAAMKAGIQIHQFVHEPLAALYGYLRSMSDFRQQFAYLDRRLVLVFDWGGGTLDLTLCQFQDGVLMQILNIGDKDVGGDAFDRRMYALVRRKHERQHPHVDWSKLQPTAQARLLLACEDAKINLSSRQNTSIFVRDILAVPGAEKDLRLEVSKEELDGEVQDLITQGLCSIESLLNAAGVQRNTIEFCLATGGMGSMPAIREGLVDLFGTHRLRLIPNAATVIAEGAAWIAHDKVGLKLAKPIEILHADDSYVEIIPKGTNLPFAGKSIQHGMDMYCVDPSDGFAKFFFARPQWPGRDSQGYKRIPYKHLTLPVDSQAQPLLERLKVKVEINDDLIAEVSARSLMRQESRRAYIHDLEFGLSLSEAVQAE